ncbi:hypothetical protein WJU16_05945 [Chitinophaga pollutisoli]|uniref:Uncharacterized protein n=1 Tax=Chitinophaga pollutisoli TaxID=3133966 RepID=A0ABZ2YTJ5_9BACT
MAKQKGYMPIQGTVGNLTFYKTDGEYAVRQKSSLDGKRIANDPKFQRTRENGQEFRKAGKAAKILRSAINPLLQRAGDKRVTARIVQKMHNALKADPDNARGERTVENGNLLVLQGFECNAASLLDSIFHTPFTAAIDRTTGNASVQIPAMRPGSRISRPKGCTHYSLQLLAAAVDFEAEVFDQAITATAELPLTDEEQAALTLTVQLPPESTRHIFLVMSIEFYQQLNNRFYHLSNGSHAAMQVVAVAPKA